MRTVSKTVVARGGGAGLGHITDLSGHLLAAHPLDIPAIHEDASLGLEDADHAL